VSRVSVWCVRSPIVCLLCALISHKKHPICVLGLFGGAIVAVGTAPGLLLVSCNALFFVSCRFMFWRCFGSSAEFARESVQWKLFAWCVERFTAVARGCMFWMCSYLV